MRICVFCGSAATIGEPYLTEAERLGNEIAKRGHSLVFGGFDAGLMGAVAHGCKDAGGSVYGVLPGKPEMFPHRVVFDCDVLVVADGLNDRKERMEKASDAFITLPGSYGTLDEFYEVVSADKLMGFKKPSAMWNIDGYYDALIELDSRMYREGFMTQGSERLYLLTDELEEIFGYIEGRRPVH